MQYSKWKSMCCLFSILCKAFVFTVGHMKPFLFLSIIFSSFSNCSKMYKHYRNLYPGHRFFFLSPFCILWWPLFMSTDSTMHSFDTIGTHFGFNKIATNSLRYRKRNVLWPISISFHMHKYTHAKEIEWMRPNDYEFRMWKDREIDREIDWEWSVQLKIELEVEWCEQKWESIVSNWCQIDLTRGVYVRWRRVWEMIFH